MPRNSVVNLEGDDFDCVDAAPRRKRVATTGMAAWYDSLYVLACVIVYIADVVTDMLVSAQYFRNGDYIWFSLTLLCVVGASLVMMMFSLKWYYVYNDTAYRANKTTIVVLHLLQLGPLKRYWDCYKTGKRSRKQDVDGEDYSKYIEQWRDITLLRLFEVFLESAPQLVLQLYILAYNRNFDKESDWLTACSACFSLCSVASSIVSYSKANRDAADNKGKMTWWAFGCQIVWRLSMVASRIVALVLFASVYKSWILLLIGLHWVAMTIWIYVSVIRQEESRDDERGEITIYHDSKILKRIFPIAFGFVYLFCFFNVKTDFTRRRLVFFYMLMFAENCSLIMAWYPYRHEYGVVFVGAMVMVFGGFFLGVVALFVYHQYYHPGLSTQGICIRTKHDVPLVKGIVFRLVCCDTCCLVRFYEDEEQSTPTSSQLRIDIPASRGSLRRDVARVRHASPTFDSEIFIHRLSPPQHQQSLEKDKNRKERAKQRRSMEDVVQHNGIANSAVVELDDTASTSNGSASREIQPQVKVRESQNSEVRNKNWITHPVDIHKPKIALCNGHGSIVANLGDSASPENTSRANTACADSSNETSPYTKSAVTSNIEQEALRRRSTNCSDSTGALCGHEVHCDAKLDEKETKTACDGGVHCGADDRQTGTTCDDGVHYGTDDEKGIRTPCDDVVRCDRDDEKDTKKLCDEGVHCGTDNEKGIRTPCDDSVHCGRDDEKDTEKLCDDGIHCGTDDEKETGTPCNGGVHCGTDDEEEICDEQHAQTKVLITGIPKRVYNLNFHHRYSIVSDCISLSSSSSSDNDMDRLDEKRDSNSKLSKRYDSAGFVVLDQSEEGKSSSSLSQKDESSSNSLTQDRVSKRKNLSSRGSKPSNRVSFPNFVATSLKRGRFSSLRRSHEDLTIKSDDVRRNTVDLLS